MKYRIVYGCNNILAICLCLAVASATRTLAADIADGAIWTDTSGSGDATLLGSATLGADNHVDNLTVSPTANGKSLSIDGAFDSITINSDLLTLLPNNVTYSFQPNVVFNGGGLATINVLNGRVDFTGEITAPNGLTKTGSSRLTLTSDSSGIEGTFTIAGEVLLRTTVELADDLIVDVVGGSKLRMWDGGNVSIGELVLTDGSIERWYGGGSDYIDAGSFTLKKGSVSAELTGSGNLVKTTGDTVTLSGPYDTGRSSYEPGGTHTYTGSTTVEAGTLALVHPTSENIISSSPTISVDAGATLDVTGMTAGFTVSGSQTLKNSGTVNGAVTLEGNLSLADVVSGGSAITSATLDDLTFGDTGIYQYTLDDSSYDNSSIDYSTGAYKSFDQSDLLTVNSLDLGSSPTIEVNAFGGGGITQFREFVLFEIANGSDDFTANFDANSFVFQPGVGTTFDSTYFVKLLANAGPDNEDLIIFTTIPEPSSLLLVGLGACVALLGLRKKDRFPFWQGLRVRS